MSKRSSFRVKGLDKAIAKLTRLANLDRNPILRRGVAEAAQLVASDAAAHAPVRSGKLKSTIESHPSNGRPGSVVCVVKVGLPRGKAEAAAQELGNHKIKAKHFMTGAMRRQKARAIQLISGSSKQAINGFVKQ